MAHSGPSQPLRPIRPRPSFQDGPSGGQSSEEGKLKRASIACTECKRRRVRCTDGTPCYECSTHSRECVYNETADKRRKIAAKHTQDELQYYRGFLEQLLKAIRLGDRANVDRVVDIVRAGASDDEIIEAVSQCLEQESDGRPEPSAPDDLALANMGLDIMNENVIEELAAWELAFMTLGYKLTGYAVGPASRTATSTLPSSPSPSHRF